MKTSTKRFLGISATTVIVIGAATAALAHGGFGPGQGGGHGMMGGPGAGQGWMMQGFRGMHGPAGMMGGDPAANADARLEQVREALAITPEQEPAWEAFETAMKGRAAMMNAHRQIMMGGEPVTAEQRTALRQQGMGQMQALHDARLNLYRILTPEQQSRLGGGMGF